MTKVISFSEEAWCEVSKSDQGAYTCPYLDKLLDEGWQITDWKMSGDGCSGGWTFILEKEY